MLPSRGSSTSEPELGKGSSPGPAAAVLGGWAPSWPGAEARTQQRKRVVRMGAVDLPAASGWTEQKSAWEVRPERRGGHVLEGPGAGFGSGSQRADTGAMEGWKLEDAGPCCCGVDLGTGCSPGSLPIRAS